MRHANFPARAFARSVLPALLLSACAAPGPAPEPVPGHDLSATGDHAGCAALFQGVDAAVHEAGRADAQAARVPGFPYLRVDRFLAGAPAGPEGDEAFAAWVGAMRALDRAGRAAELANLPAAEHEALQAKFGAEPRLAVRLDRCAALMKQSDTDDPAGREAIRAAARVPDAYSLFKRTVGLYPVTSTFFGSGVDGLHRDIRADFATPLDALPVAGRLVRFEPPEARVADAAERRAILARAYARAPAYPVLLGQDRERLFRAYAPAWEVDVADPDDRIGAPTWGPADVPAVDTERPVVYRHLSRVRVNGQVLLQLNYVVWFPARTRTGNLDLLGGHMDGITWRVTLGVDGRPLLYDSMHNCGCYHKFYATPRATPRPGPWGHAEPPMTAQVVPDGEGTTVLRVAHRTHYIQRVHREARPTSGVSYAFADYDALRSLPAPGHGGQRSLFLPDGLVPGTERGERWFFWPMGIASPGAMRQWGHHATAFVGRRHFDDPDLVERYFVVKGRPHEGPDHALRE